MKSFIADLMAEMTIEEKIAQCYQLNPDYYTGVAVEGAVTGPLANLQVTDEVLWNVGSILGGVGRDLVRDIQQRYLQNNRLKIPLLFMADVIHGYKTIFPVPLAMSCSFNPELVKACAKVSAVEATAAGVHVNFSPMVDLVRDPRWGRVMESNGEDPYLNSLMAKAYVEGYQHGDLQQNKQAMAACMKHFVGYGAVEAGRDYNTVDISTRMLYQNYFPSFKAGIDSGAKMVMTAFNTLDSIPATANKWLFDTVLRKEWGFDHVVISDWGAVRELINHGVAKDEFEAAVRGFNAGCEIEMMTPCYINHLEQAIEQGLVPMAKLDQAVYHILKLKYELGLFDDPFRGLDEDREAQTMLHPDHLDLTYRVACESAVLLKNNGILPLAANSEIVVAGSMLHSRDLMGAWTIWGEEKDVTPISSLLSTNFRVVEQADTAILVVGEPSEQSGESKCRTNIQLFADDLAMIHQMKSAGKKIVLVLINGRPLDLSEVVDEVDAILEAWFLGTKTADAVVDILCGKVNPSGKLTMSFPRNVGQVPLYYNHYNTGRPNTGAPCYESTYLDVDNSPLFTFGHGLSYSNFVYSPIVLSQDKLVGNDTLTATVTIKNSSAVDGCEVVQLYLRDCVAQVVRPMKELKGFKKVSIAANSEVSVSFTIDVEMLKFYDSELNYVAEAGEFELFIGTAADVVECVKFSYCPN